MLAGIGLFRELSPGQMVSMKLEDQGGRELWACQTAMVASQTIPYWPDGDADTIRNTLGLCEDYHGSFGVSFIVPF